MCLELPKKPKNYNKRLQCIGPGLYKILKILHLYLGSNGSNHECTVSRKT